MYYVAIICLLPVQLVVRRMIKTITIVCPIKNCLAQPNGLQNNRRISVDDVLLHVNLKIYLEHLYLIFNILTLYMSLFHVQLFKGSRRYVRLFYVFRFQTPF